MVDVLEGSDACLKSHQSLPNLANGEEVLVHSAFVVLSSWSTTVTFSSLWVCEEWGNSQGKIHLQTVI